MVGFPGGPVVKNPPPASTGAQVPSLVWEDPADMGQLSPCTTAYWSPQAWSMRAAPTEARILEPALCNKGSHRNEKSVHHNKGEPLLATARASLRAATKAQRNHGQITKQTSKNNKNPWCLNASTDQSVLTFLVSLPKVQKLIFIYGKL